MLRILERFCRYLKQADHSPLTVKNYRCDLAAWTRWFESTLGESFTLANLTTGDLRHYKRWLINQDLKPASVNRKLATLRSFLVWATEVRALPTGHSVKVPPAVPEKRLGPRWLDRREQHRLRRSVERAGSPRDLAVLDLLLHTGLRVAELCALVWKDVRVGERQGLCTVCAGKGGKRRQVPLNKEARQALLQLGYREQAGQRTAVLVGQRGPLTSRGVETLIGKYAAAAQLRHVSPHSLRHSFCKNLVNAGVSLEKVALLAGHESLETTRRYCEPSLADLEQAVELIGEEE